MTEHSRGRTLAAAALDFDLLPGERAELDDHLRDCPACRAFASGLRDDARRLAGLEYGLAPGRIRARITTAAHPGVGTRPSYLLLFAGAVLLILATFGAAIGVGSLVDRRDGSNPLLIASGNPVHWETDVVELLADDFWIGLPGQRVVGSGDVQVHSDAGSATYWTLEVTWLEHAREQRVFMYFAADATRWWVTEIRTYDNGAPRPDWLYYRPADLGAPLNAHWTGTIDLQSVESSRPGRGPATLHLANVRLVTRPGNVARPGDVDPPKPAPAQPQPVATDAGRPIDAAIEPISLADPGDAAMAVDSCDVRKLADKVAGMGRLARASDASRYVAWDVHDERPAWLVEFRGIVTVGDQDFENLACLVFDDGVTTMPLALDPAVKPTLALPPLEP